MTLTRIHVLVGLASVFLAACGRSSPSTPARPAESATALGQPSQASASPRGEAPPATSGSAIVASLSREPPGVEPAPPTGIGSTRSVSPDGQLEVFLKDEGRQSITLSPGNTVSIADLRVIVRHRDTGAETEIARNDDREGCTSFAHPRFAGPDAVVVQSNGYEASTIHNLSVCVIDVPSRKIHLLARRTACALAITAGRYRGAFFVNGMDFVVGQGLTDSPRLVSRTGKLLRKLPDNPFVGDWNGDGRITEEERSPECETPPSHLAELEKIMSKL